MLADCQARVKGDGSILTHSYAFTNIEYDGAERRSSEIYTPNKM